MEDLSISASSSVVLPNIYIFSLKNRDQGEEKEVSIKLGSIDLVDDRD